MNECVVLDERVERQRHGVYIAREGKKGKRGEAGMPSNIYETGLGK